MFFRINAKKENVFINIIYWKNKKYDIIMLNHGKAWVMPESKYSIYGIKSGMPFFFLFMRG